MTRRVDYDNDDEFEILNEQSSINTAQAKHNDIEDDSFEIIPTKNRSPSLINTNPIQPITTSEEPVSIPRKQSISSTILPVRYGAAAAIPHNDGFDLKSILSTKSELPKPNNDLLSLLERPKPSNQLSKDNSFQQLLIDNDHDRQSLVQIAKKAQQDFIDAIRLD